MTEIEEKQEKNEEQDKKVDPTDTIEAANKAAERLEAANKKTEELIKKQQEIFIEQTFGGKTEAGIQKKQKTKDEIADERAKEYLKGSGMEDIAFPKN